MHLGFISSEYPCEHYPKTGGLGTSIKNLAMALISQKIKVSVFIVGTDENRVFQENGVKIHLIKRKRVPFLTWYITRKHYQNYINSIVEKDKITALEAPDWTGITAFMKFKVPLVIRLNGSDRYFCHLDGRKQKFKNFFFERNALKNADHIISVSAFTADVTKKIFGLSNEMTIIHNSIDIEKFTPMSIENDQNTILYFGTIIRKKGVLELAKAFNVASAKNHQIKLKLIGKNTPDVFTNTSTLELFMKNLNEEAKQRVMHIPEVPYEEVRRQIAEASLIVLPSFAEAFPMTWLEAMSMEKPLITSDIGWAKEMMIHKETGYMVDPKNTGDFAEAILTVFENMNDAKQMGENARKRVENEFSTKKILKDNIAYYERISS